MTEWVDDPWIGFGCDIAEEFFSKHWETMPEDPYNVWDKNEIGYFCFAFALWAAQSKFKLKKGTSFNNRVLQYRANVESAMNVSEQIERDDTEKSSYDVYKIREQEYISLLVKGLRSLLGAITGTPSLAKKNLQSLAVVEDEVFGVKIVDGKLHPKQPKYWDIRSDGTVPVFLRLGI